jgi:hypothetical protein
LSARPCVRLCVDKRKQIQINPRKKACISLNSFGPIEAFQWVTANPNEKILSRVTLWRKYHKSRFSFLRSRPRGTERSAGLYPVSRNTFSTYSVFPQANAQKFQGARLLRDAGLRAAQDEADGGASLRLIQLHLRGKSVERPSNGPFTPFRNPTSRPPQNVSVSRRLAVERSAVDGFAALQHGDEVRDLASARLRGLRCADSAARIATRRLAMLSPPAARPCSGLHGNPAASR